MGLLKTRDLSCQLGLKSIRQRIKTDQHQSRSRNPGDRRNPNPDKVSEGNSRGHTNSFRLGQNKDGIQ